MANELADVGTFYSLAKWIGVLNEQMKNSPTTGYKASRITFDGGPTDVEKLSANQLQQTAESSLAFSTSVDFSQGDITGSYKNTDLSVNGDGFFVLCPPGDINPATGAYTGATNGTLLVTRNGEFNQDANGLLVSQDNGYYLVATNYNGANWTAAGIRAIYDNLDNKAKVGMTKAVNLTDYTAQDMLATTKAADGTTALGTGGIASLFRFPGTTQFLQESQTDPTIFDFGHVPAVQFHGPQLTTMGVSSTTNNVITADTLEETNAPVTDTTAELTLAQEMYSNLTKVLSARKSDFQLLESLFH